MVSKVLYLFVTFSLVCLISISNAKPRDIGVQNAKDDLIRVQLEKDETKPNVLHNFDTDKQDDDEMVVVKQCEYEEAAEHDACTQICIPKGYSYGLCVNYKCNCV